ncbi:cysteine proteinases superfamily protein [Wolffia australiana]
MSALSGLQSKLAFRYQVPKFRFRHRSMVTLPGSISALPSTPRSNCRTPKFFYRRVHSQNPSSSSYPDYLPHSKEFSAVGYLSLSRWLRSQRARLSLLREGGISRTWKALAPRQWLIKGAASVLGIGFATVQSASSDANLTCDHGDGDESAISFSHGKKIFSDYSITGIAGDGRCLFRSVAHGACRRLGKQTPDETRQRDLADELRNKVADEFLKRREETEWFIEGDFDAYVSQIRKPHVWGGEPEILMATHVLRMPITVYMRDEDSGGVMAIAEYGQEYGKENPIRVLYHGYGHYEALHIPANGSRKSRL